MAAASIMSIQSSPDFSEDFKLIARKVGAFARKAAQNAFMYPSYMDEEDFAQDALLVVLEAEKNFNATLNVPYEAYVVLQVKARMQALRRLEQKGDLFSQVMIDLLQPDELDRLFATSEALQTPDATEKVETFLLVHDFAKTLTPRQLKVFRCMYLGLTQAEAANWIHISQPTVVRDSAKVKKLFIQFAVSHNISSWLVGASSADVTK